MHGFPDFSLISLCRDTTRKWVELERCPEKARVGSHRREDDGPERVRVKGIGGGSSAGELGPRVDMPE